MLFMCILSSITEVCIVCLCWHCAVAAIFEGIDLMFNNLWTADFVIFCTKLLAVLCTNDTIGTVALTEGFMFSAVVD